MMQQKPYRVEVDVAAPRDAVWRAFTEPDEIRRWFGWDYHGLDEEIRMIFLADAHPEPPGRIRLDDGTTPAVIVELEPAGERTRVRIACAGTPGVAAGDAIDMVEEGWRTFLEQLRHQLEHHPGEDRRMIRLTGEADADAVVAAVAAELPGEARHAGPHQWFLSTPEYGGALFSVGALRPLEGQAGDGAEAAAGSSRGPVVLTVVTFGLSEDELGAMRRAWETRWAALASPDPNPGP
ncbi:MAG TPA: SRPBCC domain-containing protein [Solirubrobacteraceae bacterium]|nr:SRPBCC domain-containing protein [Solirubrobacteraceae bacterium]